MKTLTFVCYLCWLYLLLCVCVHVCVCVCAETSRTKNIKQSFRDDQQRKVATSDDAGVYVK